MYNRGWNAKYMIMTFIYIWYIVQNVVYAIWKLEYLSEKKRINFWWFSFFQLCGHGGGEQM